MLLLCYQGFYMLFWAWTKFKIYYNLFFLGFKTNVSFPGSFMIVWLLVSLLFILSCLSTSSCSLCASFSLSDNSFRSSFDSLKFLMKLLSSISFKAYIWKVDIYYSDSSNEIIASSCIVFSSKILKEANISACSCLNFFSVFDCLL